jgi:hypothetical protein
MEEMMQVASKWPWGFAVLVIGLGPGIGEELWCRGFLGRGLLGHYGLFVGILATSFLFGLIHLDPCQGLAVMFMGVWLHFVYVTTRSLWLPMLLHFLNNSLSVLLSRIPKFEQLDGPPNSVSLLLLYATSALLLGAVVYALYQSRARLTVRTPEQIVLWRPPYDSVEYPPEESGMRMTHPLPSPSALGLTAGSFLLFVGACLAWAWQG